MDLGGPIHPMEAKEKVFKVVSKSMMALVMKVNTSLAFLNFDLELV